MGYYTESKLREIAKQSFVRTIIEGRVYKAGKKTAPARFDVFISHSSEDKDLVTGLYWDIMSKGFQPYVDWIIDTELSRDNITTETAIKLCSRMDQSDCMFLIASYNASLSGWIPWELGYFTGKKESSDIYYLPTLNSNDAFNDKEYVQLYQKIKEEQVETVLSKYKKSQNKLLEELVRGSILKKYRF